MTPPKSVASLAQDYIEHNAVPPGECSLYWKEGFMCGHAAGLAEVGALVKALDKCISERDRFFTNFQAVELELARFKALAGEK